MEPPKLGQNHVLRRGDGEFKQFTSEYRGFLISPAAELHLLIAIRSQREDVELVTAAEVDHVKRTRVLQGREDLLFIDVEILAKFSDERLDIFDGDPGHYIQVAGRSHETVHGTRP